MELANNFIEFFHNAIVAIQDALSSEPSQSSCELAVFQSVSVRVVEHLIDVSSLTSCDLDPVPTLLRTLTSIVNLSLQSACMPGQLKEDMGRPKLKKKSLDFEEY